MPAVNGRSAAVAAHGGSRAGRRRGHDERNSMTVQATSLTPRQGGPHGPHRLRRPRRNALSL